MRSVASLLRPSLTAAATTRRCASCTCYRYASGLAKAREISKSQETLVQTFQKATVARAAQAPSAGVTPVTNAAAAAQNVLPIILQRKTIPPLEDPLLHQFARLIMRHGKLHTAQLSLSTMLAHLRLLTNDDPLPLVRRAIHDASPLMKNVSQRLTGMKRATLPLPLNERQRVRQAIEWLVKASEKRSNSEKEFGKRLALEVLGVLDGSSEALKRKDEVHRMAVTARCVIPRCLACWQAESNGCTEQM